MKILGLLLLPVLLYGLYVVAVLIFGTLNDYSPEEVVDIDVLNSQDELPGDSAVLSLMIWNVGYGGLGSESDFFLDGGKMVRPSQEVGAGYVNGIVETIASNNDVDFFLLQEVDVNSTRSYKVNEFEKIGAVLPDFSKSHAFNFNVKFVPKPLMSFSPIGKVQSGLATYSRYKVAASTRFQFPGSYSWPTRVFHLDRCLLETRIPLKNGKELILINSHNSAYDGGLLKPKEMAYLNAHLEAEYSKGNYVIVGADWNQCPPDFAYDSFSKDVVEDYHQDNIAADFMSEEWQWAFDPNVPTNRKLSTPFVAGQTFTTLIDFFLVSPNVQIMEVQGVDLDFKYSDHQPVKLKIQLN